MFLYSIYDRVSGSYSCPLAMPNDGVAKRQFPIICTTEPQFKMFPGDLALYRIGSYDPQTGVIVPEQPYFLANFSEVANG